MQHGRGGQHAALERDDEILEQDIDYAFAELGLTSGATESEVKAAWRRLVSQWHPDRNDSAAAVAKMQRINRAVEAIRRAGFPMPRPGSTEGGAAPGSSPGSRSNGAGAQQDSHTGAARPGRGGETAADPEEADPAAAGSSVPTIRRKVRLTLEEAAFGCTKVLRGRVTQVCSPCEGAGYHVLGGHCPQCHGSGAIRSPSWFSWVGTQTECEACSGGGIAKRPCEACAGTGKAETQRYQVTVRFPHGVRDGDLLSVRGRRGKAGSPPGELSIRVEIRDHDLLTLEEDGTLRCEAVVDAFAWVANRTVEVPVLGGCRTIRLQGGQLEHRLEGEGFPVERRGPRGDQLITIVPVFPRRLTTDQQILIDQLIATTSGPDAVPSDERLRNWQQSVQGWKRSAKAGR